MITLQGNLAKVTYFNEKNFYTIAKFKADKMQSYVTIIGYIACMNPGENIKINGDWETHPIYGEQFKVDSYEVTLPASVAGIRDYLKSGIIKGIGPAIADRLVTCFQENTFHVIEKTPERLLEVNGIGPSKAALISSAWKEHHFLRELMHFSQQYNLNLSFGAKLLKKYGQNAIHIIRDNPYKVTIDIPEIGFSAIDVLALKMGIPKDSPDRIASCIRYVLGQAEDKGDCFVYKEDLLKKCQKKIQVEDNLIDAAIQTLEETKELKIEPDQDTPGANAVFSYAFYRAETDISNKLRAMLSIPVDPPGLDEEKITREIFKKLAIKLATDQIQVLEDVFSHKVSVITGGPGTGKTTLIRSICAILETLGKQIFLAAPTGRAARRLSQVTGRKAETIHKLLMFNPSTGLFEKNQENPLESEALIIDEASMVDTLLMQHLVQAVPMTSTLIMVGDVSQLPSVAPGNVLSDMIESKIIRTFELTNIFRQTRESKIITNAHKVRRGEMPDITNHDNSGKISDFYFIEKNNPADMVDTIVELCQSKIPEKFQLNPMEDIQIVTPMHRGEAGTINLNKKLQNALNKKPDSIESNVGGFITGDKVMHLKNNYNKEVFNGDIGIISAIDNTKKTVLVDYEDKIVSYDYSELDELSLAYAISVHKSQGSEYPAIIMPLTTQHYIMLQRNLLYTAITRSKQLAILIGTKKALHITLKNNKYRKRLSKLASRLIS